jgi:NitT/TauT family transport system substrate-binding protein
MSIRRLSRIALGIFIVFSLAIFPAPVAVGAAPADKKIVFVFPSLSENFSPLFIAKDQRFFEEQGVDAQIVQVSSGPIAMSALAAGDAHFSFAPASAATLGAIAGGLDVVFTGGLINKLSGYFVVSPKIKTPADLKGKTLGVQSLSGGIWMFTMLALDHWGLDPERDEIQLRVIGVQAVIAQALTMGIIDGAFLTNYTLAKMVERQGYRILADLAKAEIPFQGTGILARRSIVDRSPELVEKTLKALVKAIVFIQEAENKQVVIRSLAKWLRLPRLEDAEAGYEAIKALSSHRRIIPTKEGIRNALRVLSKVNPKIGALKVEDLVDDRIARKLARGGL